MGILSFIRNQLIDIVEWLDDTDYTLVWRFPDDDHEIKNGAKLICREGQAAILVSEGKLADVFGPGTHTLATQNLPILSTLRGWKHGFESPFKVEVYFVNLRQYVDQKWGTPNPVLIRDPEFAVGNRPGRVRIRAFGSYNFRIADPRKFFEQLVGTSAEVSTDEVERFARSRLISSFSKAASQAKVSVADMHGHVDSLSDAVKTGLAGDFDELGLALTSFIVENISLPPEVEKALDAAAAQSARGVDNTMAWEGMQAMRDAARQAGGSGGTAGMGMGMGMGVGMGNMMAQTMGQAMAGGAMGGYPPQGHAPPHGHHAAPPYASQAPAPAAPPPAQPTLHDKLAKLKAAFEADLLTEDEYKAKRAQILDSF